MGPQPARAKGTIEELHPELPLLLAQLIAQPDDDSLRLDYASVWRQIGGADPDRAELIELQVETSRLVPFSPKWLERAVRCQQMLLHKKRAWTPSWFEAEGIESPIYLRGFVECVTIALKSLSNFDIRARLFESTPIRHLNIVECTTERAFVEFIEKLSVSQGSRLLSLHLDGQHLGDTAISVLAGRNCWQRLQWLSLANNKISTQGVESLAQASQPEGSLHSLSHVNLNGNPVDPVDQVSIDEGAVVHVSTPDIQRRFTDARWMHAPLIDGTLRPIVRFSLTSQV